MDAIPCALIRGGTSRGAYFMAHDLSDDAETRNKALVTIMGGPDALQVDGIGGGNPLTSKVAIISLSETEDVDIDYLFLQVDPQKQTVSDAQNCGNVLAGVGVFALEMGLVPALEDVTTVKVCMLNTGARCHIDLLTPCKSLRMTGDVAIDGVPGTAAPIVCHYLDIAGSACGALLPTGNAQDTVDGVQVTCVDNGMPVVVLKASDFDLSGHETPEELDADDVLKARLESIRLQMGHAMNLGNVADKSVPKMTLISPAQHDGLVMTHTFIPHVCHKAIGVLGAVSVASACLIPGAIASDIARAADASGHVSIEHPSGAFGVQVELGDQGQILKAGVVRTARLLFRGEAML